MVPVSKKPRSSHLAPRARRASASTELPVIAITIGDPAGIGPEIALRAGVDRAVLKLCKPVLIGSRALLARVARTLKLRVPKDVFDPTSEFAAADVTPGTVQAANGAAAARWVDAAIAGCRDGRFAAMVTCPLNKEALAAGGVPFPGHTELLAHRCGVSGEIMLMYDRKIAVALVTVHQAYTSVPGSLSVERIVHTGELLAQALRRLRKGEPRIAVLGLNPHAGEHGLFGNEESRFVVPAVEELRRRGVLCDGPLPPDTAFAPMNRKKYAGHVCLYHDQGLIPFKALAFDDGVNVTLGLPIVRTSVDHGTAFDIAWQGKATHRSLVSALMLAVTLST
ncbi:MAG: 4-hydroxythreonine-4-phosphate dehydrogenase PdxA [Planctomycetes bacterium]|nr:4-hydroxythreonine-4-phosphate dehydrogenase PdxA [Planctomycetota bacterium]